MLCKSDFNNRQHSLIYHVPSSHGYNLCIPSEVKQSWEKIEITLAVQKKSNSGSLLLKLYLGWIMPQFQAGN